MQVRHMEVLGFYPELRLQVKLVAVLVDLVVGVVHNIIALGAQ